MNRLYVFIFTLLISTSLAFSQFTNWDISKLHKQVLRTQVRVKVEGSGGSGTIIYSEKSPDDDRYFSTYILTCHHVVADAISVEEKWDSVIKKDRKREVLKPITIEFFQWDSVPHGKSPLTAGTTGDIVAYSQEHDMALIHLDLKERPVIASLLDPDSIENVVPGSPAVAVGCALLHDPIMTQGIITHQGDIIEGVDYWMSNSSIVMGNSGGAMFTQVGSNFKFIGVPSRVAVIGFGDVVTHLGYFSPISRVYRFFKEQVYEFLIPGNSKTEEDCELERKKLKEITTSN